MERASSRQRRRWTSGAMGRRTPEPRVATVAACGGDDRVMDHFPVNCELGCPAWR